jgi:hypothetical protein
MSAMFQGAWSFYQNLSCWNVSNIDDMEEMFLNATAFDQDIVPLELWDSAKLISPKTAKVVKVKLRNSF